MVCLKKYANKVEYVNIPSVTYQSLLRSLQKCTNIHVHKCKTDISRERIFQSNIAYTLVVGIKIFGSNRMWLTFCCLHFRSQRSFCFLTNAAYIIPNSLQATIGSKIYKMIISLAQFFAFQISQEIQQKFKAISIQKLNLEWRSNTEDNFKWRDNKYCLQMKPTPKAKYVQLSAEVCQYECSAETFAPISIVWLKVLARNLFSIVLWTKKHSHKQFIFSNAISSCFS